MSTSLSDRVFDPSSLDIDFNAVFERLLSPKGIVQQFLLSIALQIMNILGFTISGLGYAAIVRNTPPGPFLDFVKFFDIILTPQAIAKTVIRSLLRLLFDLGGRTVTTAFLFGVTESVSQIVASTSLSSLWTFLTSTAIKTVMINRRVFFTAFISIGFFLLNQLGPEAVAFNRLANSTGQRNEIENWV